MRTLSEERMALVLAIYPDRLQQGQPLDSVRILKQCLCSISVSVLEELVGSWLWRS